MTCVPCPCDLLGIDNPIECNAISTVFQNPPRLGQLYSALYTANTYLPEITDGLATLIQSDLTSVMFKLGIALTLPWILVILILLIVLAQSGAITPEVTIVLIIMMMIVVLFAIIFFYTFATYALFDTPTEVLAKLSDNWDENKDEAIPDILTSYLNCSYCSSTTRGCDSNCSQSLQSSNLNSLNFSSLCAACSKT